MKERGALALYIDSGVKWNSKKAKNHAKIKKNVNLMQAVHLHLCESLSAAEALATVSLLVMEDWVLPEPALMEALFTWPWLIRPRGVASGPRTGVTAWGPPAPLLAPLLLTAEAGPVWPGLTSVPFSASDSVPARLPLLLLPPVDVRLEITDNSC